MDGVAKKLLYWGFSSDGSVIESPQAISGGYSFRGEVFDDPKVPELWESLKKAIAQKSIKEVIEEAAYTWFNRMLAIKILGKNDYDSVQLSYAQDMEHTPQILHRARQGRYDFLDAGKQQRLKKIIVDYNKDQEAFALLLTGYCQSHHTLSRVFGRLNDYTELLLPDSMLQEGSFLNLLNTTDAISDEDYQSVELIGWLYQFYISERKDEVFASFKKNKKAEAKDIPAATAIFTPNWIVKYMVENTAGRIWLDKHPGSALKQEMKYLVENASDSKTSPIISEVAELTLIDPACGSGHILVEGFDLFFKMYLEEYYSPEEAVESIFNNNLYGLDIDDRAIQLATFAILLKAAKVYPDVWKKDWLPQVYAMPEAQDFSREDLRAFLGQDGEANLEELEDALRLMKQAKNLGSAMKLSLTEECRAYISARFEDLKANNYRDFNEEALYQGLKEYIPVLLMLTKKYTSVVANPPYMGQKNMNADLKNYVNANYPLSKSDLFAVFMESTLDLTVKKGYMGMINQHSWMFLSSYEKLRNHLLDNYSIVNMLHLGPRTFEELSGEVVQSTAFVLENGDDVKKGNYYRLVDYRNVQDKEANFLKRFNEYKNITQTNFSKIPGSPVCYWINALFFELFSSDNALSGLGDTKQGLITGDDTKFVRYWYELNYGSISFNSKLDKNWVPYNKGVGFQKWFGDSRTCVYWKNNGEKIKNFKDENGKLRSRPQGEEYYLTEGVCWAEVSTYGMSSRKSPQNAIFTSTSPSFFSNQIELSYVLAFLNSSVVNYLMDFLSPTQHYTIGAVKKLPILKRKQSYEVIELAEENYELVKEFTSLKECDSSFSTSALIHDFNSIEGSYNQLAKKYSVDFFQLHANEEELNRIFIDIYGLQEELTPEVPLKDITILQDELDRKEVERLEPLFRAQGKDAIELPIDKGEVISQFISYAIGLFMGRYRLDRPGLNIAHPNPSTEELASYKYNGSEVSIDEDAILPLMGKQCNFPDDVLQQFHQLLDTIWGGDTRTENVNFIQECLNKDLEKFLVKDFYKYHCKMYKKKPIYWLFASPKGAFQVLVYMHRMNAFTVEKIRANYLLEHIKNLRSEEAVLMANESSLSTQEAKRLDALRKQILECESYDMQLKDVADQQIEFDLDDGVAVNYKKFEAVVAKIR